MAGIKLSSRGSFRFIEHFLDRMRRGGPFAGLEKYGRLGVDALSRATPVDTGLTAASWDFRIFHDGSKVGIEWFNTNQSKGIPIVVLIQYGHGTRGGGYVQGRDFINPAMQPVFDQIAAEIWREVTS